MSDDDLLLLLHRMVKENLTAWQACVMLVVKRNPGASYSDIARMIDGKADGYRRYGNFIRMLVDRGLIDDRRQITHSRTSGRLFISENGLALLKRIAGGNHAEADGALSFNL